VSDRKLSFPHIIKKKRFLYNEIYLNFKNGKRNINSGYKLHFNEIDNVISYELSPSKVWNDYFGHCGLWCLVFIILYNNFDQDNRNLFDIKIAGVQNYDFRKAFIDDIYGFIIKSRSFDTLTETDKFIKYVTTKIYNIINS
jgi:hypothetical protein